MPYWSFLLKSSSAEQVLDTCDGERFSSAADLVPLAWLGLFSAADIHSLVPRRERTRHLTLITSVADGCARLERRRELRARQGADVSDNALVFVDENGHPIGKWRAAETYREHLQIAGITRAILFERSRSRQPIRLHDTRATFITVSLANGKSETWVQDRAGHRSTTMINRYRRVARTVAELGLGGFVRMDEGVGLCSTPEALIESCHD